MLLDWIALRLDIHLDVSNLSQIYLGIYEKKRFLFLLVSFTCVIFVLTLIVWEL